MLRARRLHHLPLLYLKILEHLLLSIFKLFSMTFKKPLQPASVFTVSHILLILLESAPLLETFHLAGCYSFYKCAYIHLHYPVFQLLTCQYSTKLHIAQWSVLHTHCLAEY